MGTRSCTPPAGTWGPRPLFMTSGVSPESRPLGFADRSLASVSRAGELALLSIDGTMPITGGVLFRVPMNGRAAACRTERHVGRLDAERRLAIVRATSGVTQIELPAGRSIYRTS